ncbi:UDP-glucose 4-epimerase GalE [Pseudomonas putida]|uniref:UDP-glucose 4-epimerase GalE n=1 Tax=Pseudomonas putida TaxID=303 RepID=UPI00236324DD|nr:UDP-glucose 4-epimerase GalE [Pseudomonas putida]MDD1989596.1 UDP-glucose 4-epimerase GalE [Pseudomonas putida]HDS1796270.1 UDP-glucose 4-epimerase GalE [Pseudomonas putida]
MKILVIGGAGYIGSNMVHLLVNSGFEVVVLDDLSCGHRDAVHNATLIVGSTEDNDLLDSIFSQHQISAVMHFASSIQVGESVIRPDLYYVNNLSNTIILLNAMMRANVKHLIFSSTAAVYGDPHYTPIDEGHPKLPLNPYGRTKWMAEQVLQDFDRAFGLRYTSLRYFNAAGANISASLGERHEPETHLIPLVLQAASGRRNSISVFGSDYETRDGTCVRDYIHVQDLCRAHLLALKRLCTGAPSAQYNLGNGEGFTVQEVINSAKSVTGRNIEVQYLPRREGDPATLVADSKLAKMELGWTPQRSDLNTIIQDAWAWELSHPWGRSS